MAARKLQQEIDKEFKKTDEGIALFEGIHEKLLASTNASQKEKLEDALKKEIKKLQRSRDKIKGWASQPDIKDKKPLLDKRRAIETVCLITPAIYGCEAVVWLESILILCHSAWRSSRL